MEYQITSSIVDARLELTLSGHSTVGNAETIAREVIEKIKEAGQGDVLIDVRNIRGRLGFVKTYYLIRALPETDQSEKTAVVDLEENRPSFEFHELTAANAGYHIRFFTDMEEARQWLAGATG